MASSTERMRKHRAKLKLEAVVLRCLELGVDSAVILADVKETIDCAKKAQLFVERHHDLRDALAA